MFKIKKLNSLFIVFAIVFVGCVNNNSGKELKVNGWSIKFDDGLNSVIVYKDKQVIYDDLYVTYKLSDTIVSSKFYNNSEVSISEISDGFGKGYEYKIQYSSNQELPEIHQSFYLYEDRDFVLTDFVIKSESDLRVNYMAPVNIDNMSEIFDGVDDNRALFIPFDNDKWIRYKSHPLSFDNLVSYEVTAVFNNQKRNGIVVGSVEHDNWKTGIEMSSKSNQLSSLMCYGGIATETTRDVKSHGYLTGKTIKSPKILIGYFDDWRVGMETYADANAIVSPPRQWTGAVPFGWNSWGALQFDLTYDKALQVSDFFKNSLQENNFKNKDGLVYVGLDSGWNSFSEEELKEYAKRCAENGQVAGIYWTPFTDWAKNPERVFSEAPEYKYKDLYLYANGKPQELDGAYALDPTHPAVEKSMKEMSDLFRRTGYTYVKMDFMTHGAMEADKWYNESIMTGIQGYNYGMKLLDKYFSDMYINLSISPVFPAQYAQSRRIACDAWNKIKDTEYTMNALSYGWWQDRIYSFNDPDHVVLRDATDGENRARVTSAVITGILILGDDYSAGGDSDGKDKTLKFATNKEVNSIADGIAFCPVEGNGEESENVFIRLNEDGSLDLALFNYSEEDLALTLPLDRIGLSDKTQYVARDLWKGLEVQVQGKLDAVIPAKDVLLLKFNL